MRRNHLYAIGAVLVVGFAGFALASFKETLTPYVTYADARVTDRVVQVAGGLAAGSSSYDAEREALVFALEDEETGETLPVRYHGVKPGNFEDAVSIVAIGRWESEASEFQADKLLVKCPSKYQGLEEEGGTETKTYG
ncbi:MAG: cytochrome c maturation protein CcmE [Thermoanaerobaculia bacterium]